MKHTPKTPKLGDDYLMNEAQNTLPEQPAKVSANLVKEVLGLVNACNATEPPLPEHSRERLQQAVAAKHTPGPWCVTHQTLTDQSWDIISEAVAGGICVATCGCCADDNSHVAANARLIAAVPDLLQALRRIADDPYTTCQCGDIARAAIAKAERGEG